MYLTIIFSTSGAIFFKTESLCDNCKKLDCTIVPVNAENAQKLIEIFNMKPVDLQFNDFPGATVFSCKKNSNC